MGERFREWRKEWGFLTFLLVVGLFLLFGSHAIDPMNEPEACIERCEKVGMRVLRWEFGECECTALEHLPMEYGR